MTIIAITIADASAPVEVQAWLDAHPNIVDWRVVVSTGVFYIFYEQ